MRVSPCWGALLLPVLGLPLASWSGLLRSPPEDEGSRICEVVALFCDCDRTIVRATEDNVRAFVEACRAALPTLPGAARGVLLDRLRAGTLEEKLTAGRAEPPPQLYREQCRGNDRYMTEEEINDTYSDEDSVDYLEWSVPPLRDRHVPLAGVAAAWRRGEIVRFDATELLPKRMFNVTLANLSELHPGGRDSIPAYQDLGWKTSPVCWDWFFYFTSRYGKFSKWGPYSPLTQIVRKLVLPGLLRYVCPKVAPSLEEVGARVHRFYKGKIPWSAIRNRDDEARAKIRRLQQEGAGVDLMTTTNINVQHLSNFSCGVDIAEKLGMGRGFGGENVEHTLSLLWMGQQKGGFHFDHQDNVLIQLTGAADVLVLPPSCIAVYQPPQRCDFLQWQTKERKHPKGKHFRAPFYHIVLRAGEGVVIPSMAQHRVISQETGRIALNAFMEPAFGKMQWPEATAPASFWRRQRPAVAAMRVLWLRTVRHLWETQRLSMIMHTERNEFI